MRDELLGYYERELAYFRKLGGEFARRYPKIASRLELEPDRCEDPHVERLIEAFAFLASRIHLKVDDEFPEITEALLNVLYPALLAPVPSMSIVQFAMEAGPGGLQTGQVVPRGSTVYTRPAAGTSCRFRTAYAAELWPIEVRSVRFDLPVTGVSPEEARASLRLELKTAGGTPLRALAAKSGEREEPLRRLRIYLAGDPKTVTSLYEHLLTAVVSVDLRPGGPRDLPSPVRLGPEVIVPAGFGRDEALLPADDRTFPGFRLVQEYLAFPEKFLFVDLEGLEALGAETFGDTVEVLFHLSRPFPQERNVGVSTFRLGCVPVVNLFRQVAEPILLTHLQPEYRVLPDVRRQDATEVYSIDSVGGAMRGSDRIVQYVPFYSFRHADPRDAEGTFWYATRRPSTRAEDDGTEVFLSLVNRRYAPARSDAETLAVETTCTNRDLPERLPINVGDASEFQLEGPGVFSAIRCLRKPTPSLRLPARRGLQWRLVSHLSLNVLSLVEGSGKEGPEALREILGLYDYAESSANRQQIAGITRVLARRVVRSIGLMNASYVRGIEVTLELDEQQFVGSGPFLFASVLERFLAHYASINSFCQTVLTTRQREGEIRRWPPRAGERIVQ